MLGRVDEVVIDCAEPQKLAGFPELAQAVDDAENLGAQRVGSVQNGAGALFQVMHDPEGNEWCLLELNRTNVVLDTC